MAGSAALGVEFGEPCGDALAHLGGGGAAVGWDFFEGGDLGVLGGIELPDEGGEGGYLGVAAGGGFGVGGGDLGGEQGGAFGAEHVRGTGLIAARPQPTNERCAYRHWRAIPVASDRYS